MTNKPLVCICIPLYNNKKTISETLDSLINQTYTNIIIKIFDNASTDNSLEVLKVYSETYSNIQIFKNDINIGGEANFTKCIQNLEGEFGAIFHSDDLYMPTIVEEQVDFLINNKNCSSVSTHGYIIDENSNIIGKRYIPQEYKQNIYNIIGDELSLFKSILKNSNYITCPSVMARTDIYKNKIREWNGKDFKTSADLDVWLRLSKFGDFGFISKPLIKYRESIYSYSYKDTRTRIDSNNMFLVLNFYLNLFNKNNLLSSKDIQKYNFLSFKDNINRTINQIIIDRKEKELDINIFDIGIILISFNLKENIKIYIIGILVKILRNFNLSKNIREKIMNIRFKKNI